MLRSTIRCGHFVRWSESPNLSQVNIQPFGHRNDESWPNHIWETFFKALFASRGKTGEQSVGHLVYHVLGLILWGKKIVNIKVNLWFLQDCRGITSYPPD
ncbi:unnamed protein product [Urochloa humidicola]